MVASRRWVRRFLRASRPAIREQPVAQPFGLPAAGIAGGQGQHLQPCCQLAGEHHDRDRYLVLLKAVEWKLSRASGFRCPDAVLAAGAAAVPKFERCQLPTAGVGRERGEPVSVGIGEPQLRSGVGSLGADDQSHVRRPGPQVHHGGEFGDPGTVTDKSVGVEGRVGNQTRPAQTPWS